MCPVWRASGLFIICPLWVCNGTCPVAAKAIVRTQATGALPF